MKKTLFLLPIAMMGVLSATISAPHANAAKVYKQTATVYQMKKTGKAYKIVSHTKKTTDQDINVGKTINVKGHRYYYSHVFKGYITDKAFALNAKLDAKRADVANSYQAKKQNKKTNNSSNYSNNHNDENTDNESNTNSNSNDTSEKPKIVDGYDENNQKIVDMSTFTTKATQIVIDKLNAARQSNGLQPLTVDPNMTKLAQLRAQETANQGFANISHYNAQGQRYCDLDAQQLNIMSYQDALDSLNENAGIYTLDGLDSTAELANNAINDELMEGPTGGHYKNDMDSTAVNVGVAFYVKDNDNVGFVIDFQTK